MIHEVRQTTPDLQWFIVGGSIYLLSLAYPLFLLGSSELAAETTAGAESGNKQPVPDIADLSVD